MADCRTDSGLFNSISLAVVIGAVVYGGSMLFGQGELPPPQEQVVEVRIVGNQAVTQRKIQSRIRTRAGRPFKLETIEEDVRRLNGTRLFVDVKTYSQQVPGGRIVVFEVFERPTLTEVRFVGAKKIKTKVLRKEIDLKVGDALDPFAVEEARSRIQDFYHQRGFSKALVTVAEGNKVGDRRAVFTINEGRKQRVLWTSFVGNKIASDARLRTQIESKPGIAWFFKGEVDHKQIDEDVNRLTAYYRSLGFFRAKVGRELNFNRAKTWLRLTYVIDEGPRYKVRNVSFLGHKKFATEELAGQVKLKGGQFFDQSKMNVDVAKIRDAYGGVGYVFADVKAEPRFLEEPGTIDLVYNITEGDRYRVGRINVAIKGDYPHTKITTVLNRLGDLRPGDIVDIRKIRAAERRLKASGLFLNNPMNGSAPKIVFSPPELEDNETQIARPPKHPRSNVRGQSPDLVPCDGWQIRPSAGAWPGQRCVDLTLPCRQVPHQATPHSVERPPQRTFPLPNDSAAEPAPLIVRGQDTAGAGWQTPQAPWMQDRMLQPGRGGYSGSSFSSQSIRPPAYGQPQPSRRSSVPPATQVPSAPAYGNAVGPVGRQPVGGVAAAPTPLVPNSGIFSPNSPFYGGPPEGGITRPLDMDVIAQETQTGRLMFGVGINSDAGLVGSIVVDERNFDWRRWPRSWEDVRNATAFRGAGQRFRLEAVPGTLVQRYMLNFQEPYLLDSSVSLGLSLYYYDRRYREWDEQRLGGRVALGYQFTPDLSGSLSYRGAKINVHDPIVTGLEELDEVVGDNALHGFGVRLVHDTRDSAFLATEGHLFEFGVEQVIGSFQYARADVDLRQYFLLHERPDGSGRHVLSLSARMGVTGGNTPIYEHYYAGGFSTIRGFDFRGASPQSAGILVGGEFQLLASAQYLFPITADDMLRGVVFCDTGTVEPTIDNWTDRYRMAAGFGLRITVPAMGPAPIALDFAFPVSNEPGDREEVFSFFVGFNH